MSTQGKYAESAQHCERSLAIRDEVLGPDHPDVAQSLDNLAKVLIAQVRFRTRIGGRGGKINVHVETMII